MSKKSLKIASLLAAGGMMLNFGGCWQSLGENFVSGFGSTMGGSVAVAIDGAIVAPYLDPIIQAVTPATE